MMRQSIAPLRQSHVPVQPPNAASLAKLAEKKKEFEAVAALEKASAKFLKRIEDLGDDFDVMADAGAGEKLAKLIDYTLSHDLGVCGQVMEQWPNMFRILNLFRTLLPSLDRPCAHYFCRVSCFSREVSRVGRASYWRAVGGTSCACSNRGAPARRVLDKGLLYNTRACRFAGQYMRRSFYSVRRYLIVYLPKTLQYDTQQRKSTIAMCITWLHV
jgi:hypothetical protein